MTDKQTDTRLSISDNQICKTVMSNIPPRHSSLKANHEQATADLLAQHPTERN